jgi:hypothetical protein
MNLNSRNALSGGTATACTGSVPGRALQEIAARVNEVDCAVSAGLGALKSKMDRIGIPSMFGCPVDDVGEEPGGELDRINYALDRVAERARELRGLAETLDERL